MFAEIGRYEGKVVWLKISALKPGESEMVERLFEYLIEDVETVKDKVFQIERHP